MNKNIKANINILLKAFELHEKEYSFINVIERLLLNITHGRLGISFTELMDYCLKNKSYSSYFKLQIINKHFNEVLSLSSRKRKTICL
ncbi:hypothetical protein V5G65_15135 [Mammaliicoccus sciuri]|uniref:hypothetical protein n=1 Tax=Mammaliicoccus sciuri TaxID=1296 RepID=UPI0037A379DD